MPKRKYHQFKQSAELHHKPADGIARYKRAQDIIANGQTHVARALNVAKGFERPKLGKRRQAAEGNEEKVKRLEDESEALKELDLERVANIHVFKTLMRVKTIVESELVPSAAQHAIDTFKKEQSQASQNVQARLFKYPPVKVAVDNIVANVRSCLPKDVPQAPVVPGYGGTSTSKARQSPFSEQKRSREKVPASPDAQDTTIRQNEPRETAFDPAKSDEISLNDGSEINEDMLKSFEDQLADSDDESASDGENLSRHTASDWSGSEDSPEDGENGQLSTSGNGPIPTMPPQAAASKSSATTFLPTLSMGGYVSGSEGDSDIDDTAGKIQPRKNRRGQRERQKIYELKHGSNANHLKKAVWDPRRGAQDAPSRSKWKGRDSAKGDRSKGRERKDRPNRSPGRGPESSGANTEPVQPREKAKVDAPMHPSWEAARKVKAQQKAAPFQGKKISFD